MRATTIVADLHDRRSPRGLILVAVDRRAAREVAVPDRASAGPVAPAAVAPAVVVAEVPATTAVEGRLGWLGASTLADGPLAQGAWLTLSLAGRGPGPHPSLWGAAGYGFPWVIDDSALATGARLSSWGLRGGLALDFALGGIVRGRVGIGAGIDRIHVVPQSSDRSAAGAEGDVSLGVVRASAGVSVPIRGRLSATLLLHAELTPNLTFRVATGGQSAVLTSSRFVRPAVEAALGWEF